jgi:hypothetical protein
MVTDSLVVPNALSLDARREFLATSSKAIELLHPSRQLYGLLAQTGVETRFVIRA